MKLTLEQELDIIMFEQMVKEQNEKEVKEALIQLYTIMIERENFYKIMLKDVLNK